MLKVMLIKIIVVIVLFLDEGGIKKVALHI